MTTVVVPILVGSGGSPVYLANYGSQNKNQWSSGLMDCFSDMPICLKGAFCFTCINAQNSAALDGQEPLCGGVCCYPSDHFKSRTQAKSVFGIEYDCCGDCMAPLCCPHCSECQIAREIKHFKLNQEAANPSQLVYVGNGGTPIYMPKVGAPRNNQWSSGLGDCCDEFCLCCLAFYRLPMVIAWNSYLLDGNLQNCRVTGCSSAWKNRLQAQALFSIPNEGIKDCCIAHFCGPCSEVQVHRHTYEVLRAKAAANIYVIAPAHTMFQPSAPAQQTMIATYQPQPAQQQQQFGQAPPAQYGAPTTQYMPQQ